MKYQLQNIKILDNYDMYTHIIYILIYCLYVSLLKKNYITYGLHVAEKIKDHSDGNIATDSYHQYKVQFH